MTRMVQLSGVIMDHVYRVHSVPAPGGEAVVRSAYLAPGGGFNAMVAARRMGMDVAYGGSLGSGAFADRIATALTGEGITLLRPRLPGLDQGCCTVLIDDKGERSFIASEGADGVVTDADLAALPLGEDDWLMLSGYALLYPGSRDALTRWLFLQPGRLVFDPCPQVAQIGPDALQAALHAAHWISANRTEAQVLTGHHDPATAAEALAGRPGGAVLRDGANGAWLALPGRTARHIPPHPVRPVDTNGAGDTHVGAFVAALASGHAPATACRLANIAAALSTTKEGPATAPPLADVLAIAASHPIPMQQEA
ncbi:ribokinase [Tabrizicola piscis]|uniref:Ribokinase n=1 Tax=Tabrizicola piscis TaxID=2494374 RepID=A0A3S8U2S3_9RHOB|nr:PfkB family carbohydrate kinase [Tabrizicola piscis]AZL57900.1 ribokinase [Tabrizicola piscis]